ncbi:PTS glucose transporter subunit IIA [Actinorhabdospora filicis]|uniref:PTS glucose transporter subunit IIA n=1 Tax=Actinorhabdospora filicis TaxID=1785913 RepID=A0A9W6SJE3_9ACTN|nr:PTS glucose transporter subunit IIA [Actinorhabdospora filicis]GLZ76892.1 PTS glucose transporter subunit IIA [Actinorhabdospora filicis]
MTARIVSPVAGKVVGLPGVPDPVFAEGMVGPGTAVDPDRGPGVAVAPISGVVQKLHPHAYVIVDAEGRGVLVHLGIDTVKLDGEGFQLLTEEGAHVAAGAEIVRWDAGAIEQGGRSPVVPVIALDAPADRVTVTGADYVHTADPLFTWE